MELIACLWPRRGTREPTHVELSLNPPALPVGVKEEGSGTVPDILLDVPSGATLRPKERTALGAASLASLGIHEQLTYQSIPVTPSVEVLGSHALAYSHCRPGTCEWHIFSQAEATAVPPDEPRNRVADQNDKPLARGDQAGQPAHSYARQDPFLASVALSRRPCKTNGGGHPRSVSRKVLVGPSGRLIQVVERVAYAYRVTSFRWERIFRIFCAAHQPRTTLSYRRGLCDHCSGPLGSGPRPAA